MTRASNGPAGSAATRYRQLLRELQAARRVAKGRLGQGEEARRTGELYRCWLAMTDDQRAAYDQEWREGLTLEGKARLARAQERLRSEGPTSARVTPPSAPPLGPVSPPGIEPPYAWTYARRKGPG